MNLICRFDEAEKCINQGVECVHPTPLACFKFNYMVKSQQLLELKKRMMVKHNKASLHWRDQAFYYKRRARMLDGRIKEMKGDYEK